MTFDERVKAVSEFGFTTRQARFLVTVMLHGGICVPRQYARFAGIAYGHKVNLFFDKLVSTRYAVRCRCVHNRAAVYHVRHQPLEITAKLLVVETPGPSAGPWLKPRGASEPTTVPHESTSSCARNNTADPQSCATGVRSPAPV